MLLYGMNCIVVDDNKMARMAMKQLVSQVNDLDLVAECEDAINAWNILQKEKIDLILLDIEMKGMSGLELTQKLKEAGKLLDVPVLDHVIFTDNGYFSFADEGLL